MDAVRKTGLILPVFLKLHNLTSNTSWCSLKKMFENVLHVGSFNTFRMIRESGEHFLIIQ